MAGTKARRGTAAWRWSSTMTCPTSFEHPWRLRFPPRSSRFQRQTHQIAALKEKQMETLKTALGVESEADRAKKCLDARPHFEENIVEDEPRNIHKRSTGKMRETTRLMYKRLLQGQKKKP